MLDALQGFEEALVANSRNEYAVICGGIAGDAQCFARLFIVQHDSLACRAKDNEASQWRTAIALHPALHVVPVGTAIRLERGGNCSEDAFEQHRSCPLPRCQCARCV